jgi:hypothetical protein
LLLPSVISFLLLAPAPGRAASAPPPSAIETGRCRQDLPLDAGQGFDSTRHLLWNDQLLRFGPTGPGGRWQLQSRTALPAPTIAAGLLRSRCKWRDGALWSTSGAKLFRWDPETRAWLLKADPGLEFMDFEVDMGGRMLLVCTADPRTQTYRSLLEEVQADGRSSKPLAEYPDPGCLAWGRTVPPVAAATLQVGYEAVQLGEFIVLFNPLARRVFVFRPLENHLHEAKLGLPPRGYPDLRGPLDDLCWQVLPKNDSEAWVLIPAEGEPGGLRALTLDLYEASAGLPAELPGMHLPVYPDPSGRLVPLEEALTGYRKTGTTP